MLLLTDPIDAFWPERLAEFDGKPIRSVTQGAADLAKLPLTEGEAGEAPDVTALVAALKIGARRCRVRGARHRPAGGQRGGAGGRPSGPDLQMQRLLRRAGRASFAAPPVLEINPRHALIAP